MASKRNARTGYRSAETGRFVTKETADRKPRTTVKEQIPNPGRGDTGRSKGKKRK